MTIPSLGEGQHFDAVNTIKKKSKFLFREVLGTSVLAISP